MPCASLRCGSAWPVLVKLSCKSSVSLGPRRCLRCFKKRLVYIASANQNCCGDNFSCYNNFSCYKNFKLYDTFNCYNNFNCYMISIVNNNVNVTTITVVVTCYIVTTTLICRGYINNTFCCGYKIIFSVFGWTDERWDHKQCKIQPNNGVFRERNTRERRELISRPNQTRVTQSS